MATLKSAATSKSASNAKAAKKSAPPAKKGSKLASLKNLIMGTPKKTEKAAASKKSAHTAAVKGSAKSSAKAAHPKKAEAKGIQTHPVKTESKPRAPRGEGRGKSRSAAATTASIRAALEASGETVCREVACEGLATTVGYCRMHYIKNWKKIKRKELILKERKLNQYIEELVAKYPDKYIEAIRQDLASDKDFAKVIYDLDLDESVDDFDMESESVDPLIDHIKRDFEDEGESF